MICIELYKGQGLGNQLWNYAVARIIAKQKKCPFSILGKENFKGIEFMDINFGENLIGGSSPEGGPPYALPDGVNNYYREKKEVLDSTTTDISRTDNHLFNIPPNTKFDGNCQSTKYLEGHREDILKWVTIKDEYKRTLDPNVCIIHLRAGDFMKTDAFLPAEYYKNAMTALKKNNKDIVFYCITDEKKVAQKMLPGVEIIGGITEIEPDQNMAPHHRGGPVGTDFSLLMSAHYIIISNSSFSWWAAYLNTNKKIVIAPKYWARYNVADGFWSTSDIITDGFTYLDKKGRLFSSDECWSEKNKFELLHEDSFNSKIKDNDRLRDSEPIIFLYFNQFMRMVSLKKIAGQNILKRRIKLISSNISNLSDRVLRKIRTKIQIFFYDSISTTQSSYFNKGKQDMITEYRKKIKIFDIFIFFNELELLDIRLNILDPYVDYFVIVEATETFSGKPKPLYFEENKERFKKWEHKIIHYITNNTPDSNTDKRCDQEILYIINKNPDVPGDKIHWLREAYQKEMMKKPLIGKSDDDDMCFISDIDEIWNPEIILDYTKDNIFKYRQKVYAYYLNNRSNESWAGTYATKYKNIKNNSLIRLDSPSETKYVYIKDGGWHFTNMGGASRIRTKLESYGHQEFNNADIKSKIEEQIKMNKDFIGRKFKFWIDEKNLPKYLLDNKNKYKEFFK